MDGVLPVDEHLELILNKAHEEACEVSPDDTFDLPVWYDKEKYKRGQKYIRENLFSQFTCSLSGLVCVLAIPSIINILIKTNKSSNETTAFRRYMSTLFHVNSWYTQELVPGTNSWNSLMAVRTRHFRASKVSQLNKNNQISQRDMILTQFGFFALSLICPNKLGMNTENAEDIEGYVHFWRTIGYMLGIKDKYNICRPSAFETKQVCEIIRREIYCHHLSNPPEYFLHMMSAVISSMWYYSPALSEGAFYYFTLWLVGVDGYEYNKDMRVFSVKYKIGENAVENTAMNNNNVDIVNTKNGGDVLEKTLGRKNRFLLWLLMMLHTNIVVTKFGRAYYKYHTLLTIFLLTYFPFLSFWNFGFRGAYINMFVEDVPQPTEPLKNKETFELIQY